MSDYPVILIPYAITQVREARPPEPWFNEAPPQQPGGEPQLQNEPLMLASGAMTFILSIVLGISARSFGVTLGILVLGTAAIALYTWQQWESYPKRYEQWQRWWQEYEKKKAQYQQRKQQHRLQQQEAQKPERVAAYRQQRLQEVLRSTCSYDGTGSKHSSGSSERKFWKYLHQYFPDKIQTRVKVQNPNYDEGYHYTPDFAYIDPDANLHIDIEIDEPYSKYGKPLHFIELTTEQERDRHFLQRGWLVIRFAEEQVVRYPLRCCKTIALEVTKVLRSPLPDDLAEIPDLPPIPRWTEAQARQMAAQRARERYLQQAIAPNHTLESRTNKSLEFWGVPCLLDIPDLLPRPTTQSKARRVRNSGSSERSRFWLGGTSHPALVCDRNFQILIQSLNRLRSEKGKVC